MPQKTEKLVGQQYIDQASQDGRERSSAKLLLLLLLLLLIACGQGGEADITNTATPIATLTESEQLELFDRQVLEIFTNFLEQQQFTETETRDFYGGQMHFYVRGSGTPDYDRLIGAWEATYREAIAIASSDGVQLAPLDASTFLGRTIRVGISLEEDTCVVNNTDSINGLAAHIFPLEYSLCDVNAFSVAPQAILEGNLDSTVSRHHLLIVTPMPGYLGCPEGQTRLAPQGILPAEFCLSHADALLAGFGHEAVHQTLRALYGLRASGPFPESEELLAASAESAFIRNSLQYNPK